MDQRACSLGQFRQRDMAVSAERFSRIRSSWMPPSHVVVWTGRERVGQSIR